MNFQHQKLAMLSAYKLCTFLFCLFYMLQQHTIEANNNVQKLRQNQKQALQEREKSLLEMQRELQKELHRVHIEQRELDHPESIGKEDVDIESHGYPSYCANCLGDTFEHANKNLLSSEFSYKVDSITRETSQTENEIRQLSDHNRLELIKQQILLKLDLREKPNVTSIIPKQFILDTLDKAGASDFKYSMMMMESPNDESDSKIDVARLQQLRKNNDSQFDEDTGNNDGQDDNEYDDFYGKTKEIISFADRGRRINAHHFLSFSAIDKRTQPNAKLKIRMATLWIKVSIKSVKATTVDHKSHHHAKSRNTPIHVKKQNFDHNHAQMKQNYRRRRKKDTDHNSYYYDNHNFDNHIINDKFDDNHIIKSNIYDEALISKANDEARRNSNYSSTNSDKLNITLWIFQVRDEMENQSFNYLNTNIDKIDQETFNEQMEFKTSKQISLNQIGWQKIDVTSLVQSWCSRRRRSRLEILVDCSGCIKNNLDLHIPSKEKQSQPNTPFVVVSIEPDVIKRTKRRAIDCSQAGRSQCCKQRFYVSFKTLGWDDWIIAPPGYYANYCRGDCGNGIRRTPDTLLTFYSHIFDEVRKFNKLNGNQLCCAPMKFSSMSLIYVGPDGSEIIKRDLPKMVVEECGCP